MSIRGFLKLDEESLLHEKINQIPKTISYACEICDHDTSDESSTTWWFGLLLIDKKTLIVLIMAVYQLPCIT